MNASNIAVGTRFISEFSDSETIILPVWLKDRRLLLLKKAGSKFEFWSSKYQKSYVIVGFMMILLMVTSHFWYSELETFLFDKL